MKPTKKGMCTVTLPIVYQSFPSIEVLKKIFDAILFATPKDDLIFELLIEFFTGTDAIYSDADKDINALMSFYSIFSYYLEPVLDLLRKNELFNLIEIKENNKYFTTMVLVRDYLDEREDSDRDNTPDTNSPTPKG